MGQLETYLELFVPRCDLYARQTDAGSYFPVREPVTADVVRAHLRGELTAGWYALAPDNTTRWAVLDADRPDGLEQLRQAWRRLDQKGLASQLELSRRGGHLWLLFEPIQARVARRLVLGHLPKLDGIEVFPKQDRLDGGARLGSLVRGPFGIHRLTGERYPFVDPQSLEPIAHTLGGQLDALATAPRITMARAAELLADLLTPPSTAIDRSGSPPERNGRHRRDQQRSPIERIKTAMGDPYTFIARYVALDHSGRGHCPFHPPDIHPSFAVSRGGYWVDFHETNPRMGRYVGGDAIEFYRRLRGYSPAEAIRALQAELLR